MTLDGTGSSNRGLCNPKVKTTRDEYISAYKSLKAAQREAKYWADRVKDIEPIVDDLQKELDKETFGI